MTGERMESDQAAPAAKPTDYVRFIVLAGARTGSTMLVRALNSSPHIRCFGEVFNGSVDFVPFDVEGYDNFSAGDRALRDRDLEAFLRERIFSPVPPGIGAVGFKLLFGQHLKFPGLIENVILDREIRVLRLARRNLLRALVSLKIAESTSVWAEKEGTLVGNTLAPSNALQAIRHPLRAVAALRRRARLMLPPREARRPMVTIPVEECRSMFRFVEKREARFDEFLSGHSMVKLSYEDLVERPDDAFEQAQSFLGVAPVQLTVTSRRQNPEPLRDLLANYDELRDAFRNTPYAAFFE